MDDQAYLEPDFDPSSLTVPRLRSILVAHSVAYPSSAKKGQLIELFNDQVKPQAGRLRAASLRVKRTSRGIVDVASQGSNTADDDDDDDPPPPPPSTSRSRRTTSRARTEEPQEVAATPRSARHSTAPPEATPRRASSKHARSAEDEDELNAGVKRSASRRARPSAVTPVAKAEPAEDDSPFSSENVFQSGSSPPPTVSRDTDRRRTTLGASREAERRRSGAARRKTEDFAPSRAQLGGAAPPSRRSFEMPVSAMKKTRQSFEPTAEFTPEEEHDLIRAQQAGEVVPVRRRTTKSSGAARTGISAVTLALLAGIAGLWGQEKFQVGYCGVGHHSREIGGVEVPDWADVLRPRCEPCPPHALLCEDRFRTACEPGFVLSQHPLSLGGSLPLPPTCEPDSVTARKVEAVKQKAIEELRVHNAEYECSRAPSPEVKETALKAKVSSLRRKGMTNEEFEALWESALPEIRKVEEVSEGAEGSTGEFTLRSSSLARISLSCAIRRSLRATLRQYLRPLVAALLTAAAAAYLRQRVSRSRRLEARASHLSRLALEKLSLQAALHARDPATHRDPHLPMAQLRDDVLRHEPSPRERARLWAAVQRTVERNANVRPMVREARSGDVGRVWEWIGAIGGLLEGGGDVAADDDGDEFSRHHHHRSPGPRVSFGGQRFIEPEPAFESSGVEMSQVGGSRWEEGRQYY